MNNIPKLTKVFHYETECMRYDVPKDNRIKWLEDQAIAAANREGHTWDGIALSDWVVHETRLGKLPNGTHMYYITLIPHGAIRWRIGSYKEVRRDALRKNGGVE